MQCSTIASYIIAKNIWEQRSGKIINGEGFFYGKDGELIPRDEYLKYNTPPYYERPPKPNADSTHVK
jgi:hypothetical protein